MKLCTYVCDHTYRTTNNDFNYDKFVVQLYDIHDETIIWSTLRHESIIRSIKLALTTNFSYKLIKVEDVD